MTTLVECPGCARHVRADEGRCPFCGRPSTTAAPSRMLALVLPLSLMACTSNEPPPSKPAADGGKTAPKATETPPPEPAYGVPLSDPPPDVIDPPPEPVDRPADKYGAPPPPIDPIADGPDAPIDEADPAPKPDERRVAKPKYGAPPKPR